MRLRFKYPYVQVILNDAKILHEAITDQDVIPNGGNVSLLKIYNTQNQFLFVQLEQ